MRRIKLILAAGAAMTALLVFTAAPATAQPVFFVGGSNSDFGSCDIFGECFVPTFVGEPVTLGGAAAPASQTFSERRITSGAASPSTTIGNTGNNANLAPTTQQPVNTGNVANEQGVVQSGSLSGDIDFSGSSIELSPSATGSATQTIEQSSAA